MQRSLTEALDVLTEGVQNASRDALKAGPAGNSEAGCGSAFPTTEVMAIEGNGVAKSEVRLRLTKRLLARKGTEQKASQGKESTPGGAEKPQEQSEENFFDGLSPPSWFEDFRLTTIRDSQGNEHPAPMSGSYAPITWAYVLNLVRERHRQRQNKVKLQYVDYDIAVLEQVGG